jgi:phosphoenolpyruvate carboxylase
MARTASDVLAVVLLQRECGLREDMLRVVPLFETLQDLHNAPASMTMLLGNDWYRAHIKGDQECMIGYSDSGKDAGGPRWRRAAHLVQQHHVVPRTPALPCMCS